MLEALAGPLARQPIAIPRYRYHVQTPVLSPLAYVGYPLLRGDPLIECARGFDGPRRLSAVSSVSSCSVCNAAAPTRRPRIYHDQFPSNLIDFRRELDESSVALPPAIARRVRTVLERAPPLDEGPPQFQHGDLGAEHILVDRGRGEIIAIIDWGDAGWGNPVADLVGLWAWGGDRAVHAALPTWGQTLAI